MQLGLRQRVHFPATYRGYHLIRTHGRVFGVPPFARPDAVLANGRLFTHPAVLSTTTQQEMEALIDGFEVAQPEVIGHCEGHDLYHHRGIYHAIPQSAGWVDLDVAEERRRAGAISGKTIEEVRARLQSLHETVPIEFAGWLPIFERSGNCGQHPQFRHTAEPPPGYRFTYSAPPFPTVAPQPSRWARFWGKVRHAWAKATSLPRPLFAVFRRTPGVGLRGKARTLAALFRLFVALRKKGAGIGAILRFLHSRHFQSQLLLANYRGLVFLTSMPYTFNQNPWLIEIEDPTTLFFPLIQNGRTGDLRITESPYFPIIKTMLESDQCKGIVTHMKSTAELVPTLFASDTIRKKVFYQPLGVKLPERWQRHEDHKATDEVHLLFINSWCQVPENFYVRGGLDILEAFAILRKRYPQLRLTLRTALPALDDHYHRILESGWVRVINRFLTNDEMAELHSTSHIFLLPAARIHIVSLLQAMSYGLAVVASDGWGIEEYLDHERNGLVVKGRYGKTSWADTQAGLLREDYEPMYTSDPTVVEGLVQAVSRLMDDPALRGRLGRTARADVETKYNLAQWNQGLKTIFDHATQAPRTAHGVCLLP